MTFGGPRRLPPFSLDGVAMNAARSFAAIAAFAFASTALAGGIAFAQVPALDDVGLAGLMVLVGVAGGLATRLRNRNRKP